MSSEGGTRAVVAALLANTGIAVMKFLAFALTGASSMLAEGIHSVADSGNQLLLLLGGKRSGRQATKEHPFGFGRERYIYSFLVAIVLFSVGGLFALYGAIVMEGLSFRTAIRESNKTREGASWWAFIKRAKSPELPVILLEDFAALIGLVFALLGVCLSKLTANGYFDVAGTAAIGLLLVSVAVLLGLETKSLLLGEAASPDAQRRLRESLENTEGVERVIHMRTMHLGPEELLVAVKIGVPRAAQAADVARSIDAAERAMRLAEPSARVIYVEPDIYVEGHLSDPRPEAPAPAGP
jgi:cation diffusion facilitator family transporter